MLWLVQKSGQVRTSSQNLGAPEAFPPPGPPTPAALPVSGEGPWVYEERRCDSEPGSTTCLCSSTYTGLMLTSPAPGPLGSDTRQWRVSSRPAKGQCTHSDLLLSVTSAGLLPRGPPSLLSVCPSLSALEPEAASTSACLPGSAGCCGLSSHTILLAVLSQVLHGGQPQLSSALPPGEPHQPYAWHQKPRFEPDIQSQTSGWTFPSGECGTWRRRSTGKATGRPLVIVARSQPS